MDQLAVELDMDPAELRRRNFIQPDAFPLTTVAGASYDSGEYEQALDKVLGTPATTSCAPSRPSAAPAAIPSSSASAWRRTSS